MIRALLLLLFVSLIFGLLLFAFLGTFSRLMADDFCYFANAKELGIWKGVAEIYTTWSGRYSTVALSMALEPAHAFLSQAAPGVILLAWLLSLIGLLVCVIQKWVGEFPRSIAWVAAAAILFLTCLVAPNRFQVLFWLNGSITYTVPLVALTALLYWALQLVWSPKKTSPVVLSLFCLGVLISGGFSETTSVLQFAVFALLLVFSLARREHRKTRLVFGLATAFSFAAILIFLVSPGNRVRQAFFPPPPGVVTAALLSIRYGLAFIYHSLLAYPIPYLYGGVLSMILGILLGMSHSADSSPASGLPIWKTAIWAGLAAVALVISTCFPSAYAQSAYPEARALFPAAYILVTGVAAVAFLAGYGLILHEKTRSRFSGKGFYFLIVMGLILASVYPLRAGVILDAEFQQAQDFSAAWDARTVEVTSQPIGKMPDLELKAINSQHGISELQTDPGFWVNLCFARFYDLGSVSAK